MARRCLVLFVWLNNSSKCGDLATPDVESMGESMGTWNAHFNCFLIHPLPPSLNARTHSSAR